MTLEELERCFYQAIVDDDQRDFDTLRQQRRYVLWEQAVAASGVTVSRFRLVGMCARDSSHGSGACEFDLYYDRRDMGVLYIFVEGENVPW